MKKIILILVMSIGLYAGTLSSGGSSLGTSKAFSKSNVSLGILLGSSSIGTQNYTVAGVSINYFIIDDLSVGLGYESWFNGNPSIQKLTLESTYYIPASEEVRPYIGGLYRRVLISGLPDVNAYGYRAGVAFIKDNILVSVGMVQEKYETQGNLSSDTQSYAEIVFGIGF